MWPFSNKEAAQQELIGYDDATYNDGVFVCPRCESLLWTINTLSQVSGTNLRAFACSDCGYSAKIKDGVEITVADK